MKEQDETEFEEDQGNTEIKNTQSENKSDCKVSKEQDQRLEEGLCLNNT